MLSDTAPPHATLAPLPEAQTLSSQGPETTKEVDPSTYTAAILKYSLSTKESSLYPGAHYRPLAQLLSPSRKSQAAGCKPQTSHSLRPHPFAVLHNLDFDHNDPRRVCAFDSIDGLSEFANHPAHQSNGSQLVFLRGNPSPKWITLIGVRYFVDPEFFRRHLSFVRGRDFYDLPALPSSSQNIIHLSTTSIGQQTVAALSSGQDDHKLLQDCLYRLGERPGVVGESIVRRYSVHDDASFSIEQMISICVVRRKAGGWAAIILCDHGRELDEGPKGPWSAIALQPGHFKNVFIPTIQFAPKIAAKALSNSDDTSPLFPPYPRIEGSASQSASLLPSTCYGNLLVPALMSSSPFYALHDLFAFAIASESQLINFLTRHLRLESSTWKRQPTAMTSVYDSLQRHKALLVIHRQQTNNILDVVRRQGPQNWERFETTKSDVRQASSSSQSKVQASSKPILGSSRDHTVTNFEDKPTHTAAAQLIKDYEHISERTDALIQAYSEGMEDIQNSAMLLESRKAMEQAGSVARLTLLAFLFIPLSFTTSFFGMNFKEFINDGLSIWVWFVTSVPVFGVAVGVCFWDNIREWLKAAKEKMSRSRESEDVATSNIFS